MSETLISPEQCRMARAGLGITAEELAERAGVSRATITDFELGKRSPHPHTVAVIRAALENSCVDFLAAPALSLGSFDVLLSTPLFRHR